ncbi:MAG: hypothetical protein JWN70_2296 [Planctomycetaceae bacterium]|nr:hypothetical protein [Planctomycetaceae bacterium]
MTFSPGSRLLAICLGCLLSIEVSTAVAQDTHWSFRPIFRSTVPSPIRATWIRNPADAFILSRLEKENLAPSAEAPRATLIRRVTLDLIGLPPTAAEFEAFLADDGADAYERLVDRLLASPHYGERWARVWLDLCHYGDTDGHLTDQLRPVAWRYRDWVMRAMNANLPFDDFTVAQLAGDLSGDSPYRGSELDPVLGTGFLRQTLSNREGGADLEEYRVEQIVDRTSLVGMIWMGLTVGCARCHDHKYDPLSHEDFFKLYAFFDRADEVNIDAPLPQERDGYRRVRPEYEQRRQTLIREAGDGFNSLQKLWEEKLLHAAAHPGEDHVWDRQWEVLGLVWGGGLGEGQLEGVEIVKLPRDRRTARQRDDLFDYFLQHSAVTDPKKFQELKLNELQTKLVALKKELPQAAATRAPVMQAALTPRKTFIHERGDFRSPGPDVVAGTPDWLPVKLTVAAAASDGIPAKSTEPTRLDLARWIVSRDNPLTARVVVNRYWQEFFGRGIVATSDNLGVRGAPPSHPELLDWLAEEFIRSSWDVKSMHRLIVTSATYRQSSLPRPELATVDPGNVLLARQSSLRIPAEAVRDSGLIASGLLTRTLGGPSVFPQQNERVTMEAFGSNSWPTSTGSDKYRRGLYTFMQRTSPFAQSITFDAPSPARACTRRDRSNTPLQALTLLNDPVFFEMAGALAQRILREGGTADRERLRFAVQAALARPATDRELKLLEKYLEHERLLINEKQEKPTEVWCWTKLSSVVLNLHEFVTRD